MFLPVIYEESDGTQIFRNDLVDIEFEVDGKAIKRRFDLGDQPAPTLPFSVAGSFTCGPRTGLFVIDRSGSCWVEGNEDMFIQIASHLMLMILMRSDSPHYAKALAVVKESEHEDA